jgi:hypothetical protein
VGTERLERACPEGRRFSKPVGYPLPNLSELPNPPKNWRRVGDSNSYAPKLRRFSGPVGHHLPVPSVWFGGYLVADFGGWSPSRTVSSAFQTDSVTRPDPTSLIKKWRPAAELNCVSAALQTARSPFPCEPWYPRRASNPHARGAGS